METQEQKIIKEKARLVDDLQQMLGAAWLINEHQTGDDQDEWFISNTRLLSNMYSDIDNLKHTIANVAEACKVNYV